MRTENPIDIGGPGLTSSLSVHLPKTRPPTLLKGNPMKLVSPFPYRISSCEGCRYLYVSSMGGFQCIREDHREIKTVEAFPEWCPLDDVEEEQTSAEEVKKQVCPYCGNQCGR